MFKKLKREIITIFEKIFKEQCQKVGQLEQFHFKKIPSVSS